MSDARAPPIGSLATSITQQLMEPSHGDYSYLMKSLAQTLCEKFSDSTSIPYNDPLAELLILMIMLVIGIIIIVNYLY